MITFLAIISCDAVIWYSSTESATFPITAKITVEQSFKDYYANASIYGLPDSERDSFPWPPKAYLRDESGRDICPLHFQGALESLPMAKCIAENWVTWFKTSSKQFKILMEGTMNINEMSEFPNQTVANSLPRVRKVQLPDNEMPHINTVAFCDIDEGKIHLCNNEYYVHIISFIFPKHKISKWDMTRWVEPESYDLFHKMAKLNNYCIIEHERVVLAEDALTYFQAKFLPL